jgi:hypothetical protein
MDSFLKKVATGDVDDNSKRYFLRFGKGDYKRRFLISFSRGAKIKIKGSFEWANDFVEFIRENADVKFSGKVYSKGKVSGMEGRKKGGSFVYEVEESSLEEFEDVYFYLLNCNNGDIILKVKKSLPKPGKDEGKIDDKFCSLDLEPKYWDAVKEAFFWDLGKEGSARKCSIEHELVISDVDIPSGASEGEVRDKAVRKGKLIRKINCEGKEEIKEYELEV